MKKVVIFTEHSKVKGKGHFYRSHVIFRALRKFCYPKIFVNKKNFFISKYIKKKKNLICLLDFKKYHKNLIKKNKHIQFIIFDNEQISLNNCININPLIFKKKKYYGPKWFPYNENYILKKKFFSFKKKKNLFITQGSTDSKNDLRVILKIFKFLDLSLINKCYIKTSNKISKKKFKNNKINIIYFKELKSLSKVMLDTDIAITGGGNLLYETSFFGIPSLMVSSLQHEIQRCKLIQKKGIAKFFLPFQTKKITAELNKIIINKKYFKKLKKKKIKHFHYNGLKNIINLIKHIHKQ